MISNIYNRCGTSGFAINICNICSDFIIKNWQRGFINAFIWNGFKRYFKITRSIGYRFAMCDFLWFTIKPRSVPIVPTWVLYLTMYTIDHLSISNVTSCISQCISFYCNRIVNLERFCNRIEFGFKFWTFIFFNRKV